MELIVSEFNGACAGVRRALDLLDKARSEGTEPLLTAPICHNAEVNRRRAVRIISGGAVIGNRVMASAHGISKGLLEKCERDGIEVLSATCEVVSRNLNEIRRRSDALVSAGVPESVLLYLGKAGHDEAEVARSWLGKGGVFISGPDEAEDLARSGFLLGKEAELMAQTSLSDSILSQTVSVLKKWNIKFTCFNRICPDCSRRREAARLLGSKCDFVIVAGDRSSSNARELVRAAEGGGCRRAILALNAREAIEFAGRQEITAERKIGIISSASSTGEIFDEIREGLLRVYG